MIKSIAFAAAGLAILASPLLASAQTTTTSSNTSLIAVLAQLVQVLEQELQQFLAAQGGGTTKSANQPSATINQSSLQGVTILPHGSSMSISGTYANAEHAAVFDVTIVRGVTELPTYYIPTSTVIEDMTDRHGGLQTYPPIGTEAAVSGTFVDNEIPQLTSGTYTIGIYAESTNDENPELLVSRIETVNNPD